MLPQYLSKSSPEPQLTFRKEILYTILLLSAALVSIVFIVAGIFQHKYFLEVIGLLIISLSGLLLCGESKLKGIDWPTINPAWYLIGFALMCLLLREMLNSVSKNFSPSASIILILLTLASQFSFTGGLMSLAWPTERRAEMRSFIDSLIIVLAILVMAWTEGVHPFFEQASLRPFQNSLSFNILLWLNTVSGVLLLMSVCFFFIASQSKVHPNRSTLWIFWGAVCSFLIHFFRTYSIGVIWWNNLSTSWLIFNGVFTILAIVLILIGVIWHGAELAPEDELVLPQISSRQRTITLWFPYGVALAVALLLTIRDIRPDNLTGSGLLPIVLLMIAIVSRQMLTMWDNLQLSEQLTESNINLENNVMERTRHLATLHSITSALNSSLDRNSVLKIALEQIMDVTDAEHGAIWLNSKKVSATEKMEWHLAYGKGFAGQHQEEALRNLAIGTVEEHHSHFNDSQKNFERTYGFSAKSARILIVPIRSGGLLFGAQALILKNERFNYDTRSVVESVALEMGTSLQNAHLYQEARQRADRDGVTGLYNHRSIQEQLATLLRNSREREQRFSVLMMDLNDFKYFNDTYGHPIGDEVLRTVAMQLEKICGENNPVGRYGGDEFIVLLPGQDHEQTRQTYQNLLSALEKEHFEVAPGVRIPINMSYGWSVFPDDGQSALDLITIADANLYRYKQRGELEDSSSAANRRTASVDKSTAFGVLDALITAIDNKDHYTRKHSDEVARYAILIAEELGYSAESLRAVRISGLLHDVGKIAVPDDILRHPGKLSQADWEIMKQHPSFGALIVKDLPYLEDVISGIRSHHERWDGRGYPDGLSQTEIPIMGRLLAVPDAYSALTTNRPYRKGHSPEEALLEIERSIRTQFDPLIAKTFIEIMTRQTEVNTITSDVIQSPTNV